MKVLSLGHIPSWAGGRQESGLANVIYQLAKHISNEPDIKMLLAATDVFELKKQDGALIIAGWTKRVLLCYILRHPFYCLQSYQKLKKLKKDYPLQEPFWGLFFKRVFFKKTCQEFMPDIVHLHGPAAIWYLDIPEPSSKIAVTFHGITGTDSNLAQFEVLNKMEHDVFHSDRVSDFFFICTQLVPLFKKAYEENHKKNTVIFNAYDSSKFFFKDGNRYVADPQKTTLCTVASLSDLKGQYRVLKSLSTITNKGAFKYFCIGGDSEGLAESLSAYAVTNEIDFEYLGKKKPDQIREELYKADYMIMPSSSEGFGLTFLEAIACGVPVILPRNIPIAEEKDLINEKNSILLDDCSEMSITKVLSQINKYHFEPEAVANSFNNCSWSDIARQYVIAFKNL